MSPIMPFAASVLCLLCGTLCFNYSLAVTTKPPCKEIACRCRNATMITDSNGCRRCFCPLKPVDCPDFNCLWIRCPTGFRKDQNGCQTCDCNSNPQICPRVLCPSPEVCESESFLDDNGCLKCRCKKICPQTICPLIRCEKVFAVDSSGCNICRCRIPQCPRVYCLDVVCPNGFRKSLNGCPTCTCNPQICPQVLCPSPEVCESESFRDDNGCLKCRCKKICSGISCIITK